MGTEKMTKVHLYNFVYEISAAVFAVPLFNNMYIQISLKNVSKHDFAL